MSGRSLLALDIGGTKIAAALVDLDGRGAAASARIRVSERVPTPAGRGRDGVLGAALDLAGRVVGDEKITAVGIGSAGVVDPAHGVVTSATDAIPGWSGADLSGVFGAAFGVAVAALNDVHAHALGEARFGAGRGARSMLLVAVGTGIGGAHVIDGGVITGAHHVAGHLGHVPCRAAGDLTCTCGRPGHLEALASGPATLAAYRRAGGVADSTEQIARLAAATDPHGSPLARGVLAASGRAVGEMIGGMLNVLDPDVVVLTGGMAASGDLWHGAVEEGRRRTAMDPVASTPLVPASGGVEAALLGAAVHAVRPSIHAGGAP